MNYPHDAVTIGVGTMEKWAGVYDALSALQAEKLGYDGLWVSSLGLSVGRLGMPDAGFLEPSTVALAVSEIARVVQTPLVVDIENGYGLDNVALAEAAGELLRAGSAALCIEDTVGVKRNSLWSGFCRDLHDVDAMCDRLAGLVSIAQCSGGTIIARTEALVEGRSIDEATYRVRKYAEVGCGGVVVHFRDNLAHAIETARRTAATARLIVIPTAAPTVQFVEFEEAGFSVYVAANIGLRAAAMAIETALASVLQHENQARAAECGATLAELDALVRARELVEGWVK
jgi:phosphoenolpyruvate phosphomutase